MKESKLQEWKPSQKTQHKEYLHRNFKRKDTVKIKQNKIFFSGTKEKKKHKTMILKTERRVTD